MLRIPTHRSPPHPGEVLREEFLIPLRLTQSELAERIGVTFQRINAIVNERRGITPNTALRLSRFLGTEAEFWLNLQLLWDMYHELHSPEMEEIEKIEPLRRAS